MRTRLCLLMLVLTFAGCDDSNAPQPISAGGNSAPAAVPDTARAPQLSDKQWQRQIEAARLEKDRDLKLAENSPMPPPERASFKGLQYFPIDTSYRVTGRLKRFNKEEPFKMLTSTGEKDDYVRYGSVEFTIAGTPCTLDVFKSANDKSGRLFIPFRDATSGKESYGAGRYIEIVEDGGDSYVLDFNLAYNPYCAYNTNYSCPIPPAQNSLKVAVRAGEKTYHD
jgi:uncharacterized protein